MCTPSAPPCAGYSAGDHVVMSYPWCGGCANCRQQRQNYCVHGRSLKSGGTRADGSTLLAKNGAPVYGAFFQQSSFGTFALSQARYAVKVRSDAPLELLGPLACSGQTGAGAVLNVIKPVAGESIAVFGVGAVGLSALMAAKIAGCDPIVAVDVHDRRLSLARELGATHTINHNTCADVIGEIRKISGGGVRYALETSAVPAVFREAIECLMPAGTCVLLGSARGGSEVSFEMPFLQQGRVVRGVVQGDSVPQEFIPKLVDLIMAGKFPIERMIKFYDLADINLAAQSLPPASRSSRCCACRLNQSSPGNRFRPAVIIFFRITERAPVARLGLDRAGDGGLAMLRGVARPRALGDHLARNGGRLADVAAVIAPHQIDVDVIVMIDVGAGRQHGGEILARRRLHVVQESLLLRRAVPAVLHRDFVAVGQGELGDVERVAEGVLGNMRVRIAVHAAA